MFQKCPICEGEGVIVAPYSTTMRDTCPTCQGSRIINEDTGFAPGWVEIPCGIDGKYFTGSKEGLLFLIRELQDWFDGAVSVNNLNRARVLRDILDKLRRDLHKSRPMSDDHEQGIGG